MFSFTRQWKRGRGGLILPHLAVIEFTHRWPDGSVKRQYEVENRLFYEGQDLMLNFTYRAVDGFAVAWYGRLCAGAPADSATLATLTGEPSGSGYGGLTWTRNTTDWAAIIGVGTERQTRGLKKTYSATGDWPEVTTFLLATVVSGTAGKAFSRFTLDSPLTLLNGEDFDVRPIGVLRGASL